MKRVYTIFRKELRDTLRDRRTLVMMVLLPLILVPLILVGTASLAVSQQQRAHARALRVALVDHGAAPAFRALLEGREDLVLVEDAPVDSARSFIRHGHLDAMFVVSDSFDLQMERFQPGVITMYFESDAEGVAPGRLRSLVGDFRVQLLADRLEQVDLRPTFVQTVDLQEVDVATAQEVVGRAIGGFLPYLFLIFCYLGAMYPAIDLAAGEKERSTLESLLTSPATRMEILAGKFGVVVLAGLASAMITLVGLVIGVQQAPELPPELLDTIRSILSPGVVLLELSLLLPLTMFFAAVLLTLSVYARSFKEAQSIVSPMAFVVVVPAAIGMMPGMRLTPVTALIPVLNVSLATKDVVAGTVDVALLVPVYLSLIVLAGASLWLCAKYFRKEDVLFRS